MKKAVITTNQIIAKEGLKTIFIIVLLMLICVFVRLEFLALLLLGLLVFGIFVFRNPERIALNRDSNIVISPCDGTIREISLKDNKTTIKIKVNLLCVGLFRAPIDSSIFKIKRKFGLFINGDDDFKEVFNARHSISAYNGENLAYRITLFPEIWNKASVYELDSAFRGDRIGFMKYGYLVFEFFAPLELEIQRGDSLFAGESVIGRIVESDIAESSTAESHANINEPKNLNRE